MDDQHLAALAAPHLSLNRFVLADLPGVALDPEVRGQRGFFLVSALAIVRAAAALAEPLGSPPGLDEQTHGTRLEVPRHVDRMLAPKAPPKPDTRQQRWHAGWGAIWAFC